ncbi:MAG TPA: 2OG-Fe(II) oxygenase [Mycobacterium sp.]|nr:2OG-Fe(II) oxygenase [Mycobacterium sp.]
MNFDKPALLTDKVAIFDDVFDADYAAELLDWVESSGFKPVHFPTVSKPWRPHDGAPLMGPRLPMPGPSTLERFCALVQSARDHEALRAVVDEYEDINFCPWVYPPDSGLSLHADEGGASGSYIYFAHSEWRPHWGGMLCVLDQETPSCTDLNSWIDDREEAARVLSPGHGLLIFPKPNRLVFMAPDALHFVTQVTQSNRISIAGFFTTNPPLPEVTFDTSQITWREEPHGLQ